MAHQRGVVRSSVVTTALTAGALASTAYSGLLNRRMAAAGNVPVLGATKPGPVTSPEVAGAQRQLGAIQWLVPALTGALVGVSAWQSEQQRPRHVLAGVLPDIDLRVAAGVVGGLAVLVAVAAGRPGRGAASRHDREVTAIAAQSRLTAVSVELPASSMDAGGAQPPTAARPSTVPAGAGAGHVAKAYPGVTPVVTADPGATAGPGR